jgi:hypothetical protein
MSALPPAAANRRAQAAPKPLPPPVMKNVLPSIRMMTRR